MAPPEIPKKSGTKARRKNDYRVQNPLRTRAVTRSEKKNQEAITEKNSIVSPIFRLPPELRNKIYEYVYEGLDVSILENYASSKQVLLLDTHDGQWSHDARFENVLATTMVCRQWFHETYLLPYKCTLFAFKDHYVDLADWLTRLEKTRRNAIRTIKLSDLWVTQVVYRQINRKDIQALSDCQGLKKITFLDSITPRDKVMIDQMAKAKGIEVVYSGNIKACQIM